MTQWYTHRLTEGQSLVLKMAANGLSNTAIAKKLDYCSQNIQYHFKEIRRKTGATTDREAIKMYWLSQFTDFKLLRIERDENQN